MVFSSDVPIFSYLLSIPPLPGYFIIEGRKNWRPVTGDLFREAQLTVRRGYTATR